MGTSIVLSAMNGDNRYGCNEIKYWQWCCAGAGHRHSLGRYKGKHDDIEK